MVKKVQKHSSAKLQLGEINSLDRRSPNGYKKLNST